MAFYLNRMGHSGPKPFDTWPVYLGNLRISINSECEREGNLSVLIICTLPFVSELFFSLQACIRFSIVPGYLEFPVEIKCG